MRYICIAIIFLTSFNSSFGQSDSVNKGAVTISADSKKGESVITFYYLEGVKYFLNNNIKAAEEVFDYIISNTNANHAPALYYQAAIEFRKGSYNDAKIFIKKAQAFDSLNTLYLQLNADICISLNEVDSAIDCYNKLIDIEPQEVDYIASRIFLTSFTNTTSQEILAKIDDFESLYGFDERLYSIKREILIELQKYDLLEEYSLKVLQQNPNAQNVILNVAQLYAAKNESSKAIEFYNKAIELDGDKINAFVGLAEFYKLNRDKVGYTSVMPQIFANQQVKFEYKIESFISLIGMYDRKEILHRGLDSVAKVLYDADGNQPEVLGVYLEYLLYSDNNKAALALCDTLYANKNLPASAEVIYVQLAYQLEQKQKAAKIGYEIALKNPQDVLKAALGAEVLNSVGEDKKALFLLNENIKAVKGDSLKSVAYGNRADFYYKLGKPSKYYPDYAKALQYDADNAMVLNNLAYFMSLQGKDLNEALLYAKRANELSPQNPTYLDTQAWVNFTMGRYDEAKRLMQLALALEREPSFDLLLHYGDILYALGDDFMAREYWKRSLSAGADKKEINDRLARPKAVK